MDNECILHNCIVLAICVPKIIKFGGNLTKFWQTSCNIFLDHPVLLMFSLIYLYYSDGSVSFDNMHVSWHQSLIFWSVYQCMVAWWTGVMVRCQTYGWEIVGSTPGQVIIQWLLLRWMTDYWQTGKPFRYITNTKVNSAFHSSGVGKLSTGFSGWS